MSTTTTRKRGKIHVSKPTGSGQYRKVVDGKTYCLGSKKRPLSSS